MIVNIAAHKRFGKNCAMGTPLLGAYIPKYQPINSRSFYVNSRTVVQQLTTSVAHGIQISQTG